jgi:hypothetical protein
MERSEKAERLYEKWQEWEEEKIQAECCYARAILTCRGYYTEYLRELEKLKKAENENI